jgi:hypothetical protein
VRITDPISDERRQKTKSPTADVEEVDEGVPLLDEQDGQLDATEIAFGACA